MLLLRKLAPAAALATLALSATPAFADAITLSSGNLNQAFTVNYNGFVDSTGTPVNGLASVAIFTLTGISTDANGNTSYMFDYSMSNTSSSPITASTISNFGFDVDPAILGASSTGAFSYSTLNSTYPNGIGSIDVCFKAQFSNSCSNGGGVTMGNTGTGTMTLSFTGAVSSITMSNFYDRYQAISGAGSTSSASGAGTLSSTSGGTTVPEPGMLGLLGGALIVTGLLRRRRTAKVTTRVVYA